MSTTATTQPFRAGLRGPVFWGLGVGVAQAATPLAFWWLDTATVYALGLAVIASIYIGFAVADGRWIVLLSKAASQAGSSSSPPQRSPAHRGCLSSASLAMA